MIRRVNASIFNRFMANGCTSPILLSTEAGDDGSLDVVVKLNGGMDAKTSGAVYELTASRLASLFNLGTPEPILVFISKPLADVVSELLPDREALIQQSVGWNFGTKFMKNFAIWPVNRLVPDAMIDTAADVFAFDALIQNPDRGTQNPNCGTQGESLQIFDHERAFSFLYNILRNPLPWDITAERYLDNHVFLRSIHKRRNDWRPFLQLLARLSDEFLAEILQEMPPGWDVSHFTEIKDHLMTVRDHSGEFELHLQRRCA